MTTNRARYDAGAPHAPASADVWAGAISDDVDAVRNTAGLTIVEVTLGVWSADAPVRAVGVNPIVFVGVSDPADVTNGITTPANINERDRWIELASL